MLNSLFMDILYTTAILGIILVLYIKYKHTYWQKRGVPTLPCHWLFGNLKDVIKQRSPALVMGDLYLNASENDDILGFYIFHKPFLLLRNPEIIKQILIKDFDYFPNRAFTTKSFRDKMGRSNLFSIENPEWRYLRTKLSPTMTSGKLKKTIDLIVEAADSMNKYLEDQFSNGPRTKTILIKELAMKYTTNIIYSVAFGIQVNSFDPEQVKFYEKAQEGLEVTFYRTLQLCVMFFFPDLTKYMDIQLLGSSTNYFRKIFWDSIDTREMTKAKRGDLIDSLIELKNEKQENIFKFEGDALVSQSAIFFIAGRESSVTTVSFALYELAKHPEIQKRTREEIYEKLKEHGMTYESIQSMKYLHQVLSEVLRLYPPAPLLDRVAVKDYKIPGTDIIIEKGTSVYVPLCGLHCDPKYHPDPLQFNPDRFSDENKENIKACTYMPFGEGPRVCIGTRLGLLQSALGVISVVKDYEISLDPTYNGYIHGTSIFLTPVNDFRLNLTKLKV